ncbi:hypothetical protein HPB51_028510 [Rhipicephalus microplus]|uniref:Uncharacterized protein n=1 Tax=Rhipicephalus microplus TaxID=6941 RepID=A0A9J6CXF2_RHIMP|nr:hypothetical protein HPB51_028510 [Rhipicephalus microplus]
MGTSLGSSTAAPTSSYLPEYQSGMPTAAAQQVTGPGPVADFGNMVPSGSHQQATTALTTPVAASVPPLVPPAQDIQQKIDEACAVLRQLAMQQSSREPSTSNAVSHQHTPARYNCGLQQPSASLAHMTTKLTQISNTQMNQDEDEPSASEVEEKAMFPSTLKVDSHASKIHTKNFTRFRETPANAQGQLSASLGSRTVPANSVVLSADVASKLVSVLNTVENLASGIASRSGHEIVKSLHTRNGTTVRANLCASCKVTEKKERDSLADADHLSDDGRNEDEDGVPGRKHKHKTKHRPARTNGTKYNAHEESVEQNEWDYEEGLSGNETEREDDTEDVAFTALPHRRWLGYSSFENDREAATPEQDVRSGARYNWIDPTDGTSSISNMHREPPRFMRNQRFLPPYCYGGPRLEYQSYLPTTMQRTYLQPNPALFLNSTRAPLARLVNQVVYQGPTAEQLSSNLRMFAQGQGYNHGPSPLPRAPLPRYTYPQVSHQSRRSKETGGQLLSGHPSTMQQVYSIDASYGQQLNQAQNYSHAYQNVVPSGIGEATSSRPYVQPAQNVVPERAMTAVTSTAMVPCERNMTLVALDASSSRHGGSASSLAVKPAQQAGELFHAEAPVETEAFGTALPQSRPSPSREERPIPAKKPHLFGRSEVSELGKIFRHEDDIRWDEQLRERSRLLREERIRQEDRSEQRQRMQDQERLLREERQFQADLERRREADKDLLRALERENEAEVRATAAVLQILASTQHQENAHSSAGASLDNQIAAEEEASSSDDDAVVESVSPTPNKPEIKAGSQRRCSDAGTHEEPSHTSSRKTPLDPQDTVTGSTSKKETSTRSASPTNKVSDEHEN